MQSSPLSVLADNLHLTGDLDNDGDLQIDGKIEGNVRSKNLTVGASGKVEGSIEASDCQISGQVIGNIMASKLKLTHSADVKGDIIYDIIHVEEGAKICGNIKVKSDAPSSSAKANKNDGDGKKSSTDSLENLVKKI